MRKLYVLALLLILIVPARAQTTDLQKITFDNIDQLELINVLGDNDLVFDTPVWSPDGTMLAQAGSLGVTIHYPLEADHEPTYIEYLPDKISSLAFSPDSSLLATATLSKIVIHDIASGDIVLTLEPSRLLRIDLITLQEDAVIAFGRTDADMALERINFDNRSEVLVDQLEWGEALFPNADMFVIGQHTGMIDVFNLRTKAKQRLVVDNIRRLESIAVSPDQSLLAAVNWVGTVNDFVDDEIEVFDLDKGEQIGDPIRIPGEYRDVDTVGFDNSQHLVSASDGFFGYRIHVREITDEGDVVEVANDRLFNVDYTHMTFNPQGTHVLFGERWNYYEVWDWESRSVTYELPSPDLRTHALVKLVFSEDSRWLLISESMLYDAATDTIHSINRSTRGNITVDDVPYAADIDETLQFTFASDTLGTPLPGQTFEVERLSPGPGVKLDLIEVSTGTTVFSVELAGNDWLWNRAIVHPDGSMVAVVRVARGGPDDIHLFDLSGQEFAVLSAPEGTRNILFSADGRALIVTEAQLAVWSVDDIRNGTPPTATAPLDAGERVMIAPDDNLLYSHEGTTLKVWSIDRFLQGDAAQKAITLPVFERLIRSVRFSPDSQYLVGATQYYEIVGVWGVPID